MTWSDDAAYAFTPTDEHGRAWPTPCNTSPTPKLWDDGTHPSNAKALCQTQCAVVNQCLDHAIRMELGQPLQARAMIWGGTTPRERFHLERRGMWDVSA
jgi:hypothetical protein